MNTIKSTSIYVMTIRSETGQPESRTAGRAARDLPAVTQYVITGSAAARLGSAVSISLHFVGKRFVTDADTKQAVAT
jgi:hypothetical protein